MRPIAIACLALLAAGSGCAGLTPRATRPPLASTEGELFLYLQPLPGEATRLSFTLTSMSAIRADGASLPLELVVTSFPVAGAPGQRLLATARLPPGSYQALEIVAGRAELLGPDGPAQLAVEKEPSRVAAPFAVVGGRATVLAASWRVEASVAPGYVFTPKLAVAIPPLPTQGLDGLCANTDTNDVTLFDKRRHEVFAVVPTGRSPYGVALGGTPPRLYVAVSGEDRIEVQDLTSLQPLPPVRLNPGDRPRELAVSPDGRTLVVINQGSNTAAFVNTASGAEISRVATGYSPVALLVDRSFTRAYVLNDQSNSLTVLDLAARTVVGTAATDTSPLRAQLNRAGNRLYVIHAGSPQMNVYALPSLTVVGRVLVGFGAGALKVDPRSDLIYVARRFQPRVDVYDPFSLIPIDSFAIPGPAGWLTIDDTENALVAVVPSRRVVATVDLAGRAVTGAVAVGESPYAVTLSGERF